MRSKEESIEALARFDTASERGHEQTDRIALDGGDGKTPEESVWPHAKAFLSVEYVKVQHGVRRLLLRGGRGRRPGRRGVPREPQKTSREFYNAHNGNGLDVDARLLPSVPGDPWSYPSPADRDVLLDAAKAQEPTYAGLWNGPRQICEGSGSETLGISLTEGSACSTQFDVSVEIEASAGAGGVEVGRSVGFEYGFATTLSTSDTTFLEGRVGCIPAESFTPENRYQYGSSSARPPSPCRSRPWRRGIERRDGLPPLRSRGRLAPRPGGDAVPGAIPSGLLRGHGSSLEHRDGGLPDRDPF